MEPNKIISPSLQKIIEMTEKVEKSIPFIERLSKQTMVNPILIHSAMMSVAKLRDQKTGIAGIMQRASELAKYTTPKPTLKLYSNFFPKSLRKRNWKSLQ